ncbi:MAG: NAD(P)H-hydrate dehydratase [Gemmatimonadetes bacterium]|nr:NAD(P)H-hydrate dehydratase [Gemmatimonadota bacterium]
MPAVTPALLRRMPLPRLDDRGDKEDRGRVLVLGGALEMPGALVLAGIAALRAGAGKLQLATCRSIAPLVGIAVPEARVVRLDETPAGGISSSAAAQVVALAEKANALLIGPGMMDPGAVSDLVRKVLAEVRGPTVVLDAEAMSVLAAHRGALHALGGRAVITPHAGEMASLLGIDKDEVSGSPLAIALRAAAELRCVVALKGSETFVASQEGDVYRYAAGGVGLATSGSGDTLAGIVAGLAARDTDPLRAALWGVALHGAAGNTLARRMGPVGFLARELLDEIPKELRRLDGR